MKLPRVIVNQILQHAQTSPEAEVCGLIGGHDGEAASCYPIHNAADTPGCRYWMEPHEQIEVLREMRERGEELCAIYHSHPHSPPLPSGTDMREARYPEAVYLIVSLDTRGVLEMRGFRLRDGRSEAVDLELG